MSQSSKIPQSYQRLTITIQTCPPPQINYTMQAWDIQGGGGHPGRGEYSTFSVRTLLDQPKTDLPTGFPQLKEISFKMSTINLSNSLPLSGQPYANMLWKRRSPVSIYPKSINSLTIVSILPVLRNWCLNLLFSCQ